MNADHANSIQHYAETLLGRTLQIPAKKTPQWLMTGVDAEGCDLRRCGETPRLYFAHTVATVEEMRTGLTIWLEKRGNKVLKNPYKPLIHLKIENNCCLKGLS